MSKRHLGTSFPFRISNFGGIAKSSYDYYNPQHIIESIQQVIGTTLNERVNEEFGSNINFALFEPNDLAVVSLLKYEIVFALAKYEPRITVTEEGIDIYNNTEDNALDISITFIINEFDKEFSVTLQVGGN